MITLIFFGMAHQRTGGDNNDHCVNRDDTAHVFFEAVDTIAETAALALKTRVNLTHHHNVFASTVY